MGFGEENHALSRTVHGGELLAPELHCRSPLLEKAYEVSTQPQRFVEEWIVPIFNVGIS